MPLARALPREAPGRAARPASWGGSGSHAPGRRGCGCRRARGPAEGGGGELGRPGAGRGAEAKLERNFPSQPANFEARRRGAQLGRPAWARGASMSGAGSAPLSPPLQPRWRGGAGAQRRRGSPAFPAAPASIATPRALIGLGAATTRGGVPGGPPRESPGRGGERRPRPTRFSPRTESGAQPLLPGQLPGGGASPGFHRTAHARWGPSAGEGAGDPKGRELRHHSLRGVGAPLPWRGGPWPPPIPARPALAELASTGSESPLTLGISHNQKASAGD